MKAFGCSLLSIGGGRGPLLAFLILTPVICGVIPVPFVDHANAREKTLRFLAFASRTLYMKTVPVLL